MKSSAITSILGAIATAIGFAIDIVWGWRVLGAFMILAGVWTFWTRRAAYAAPGHSSGHLSGASAVASGLVNLGIGLAIIINAVDLAAWVRRVI